MTESPNVMTEGVRRLAVLQRADGSFTGEHWGAGAEREPTTSLFATALVVCATTSLPPSDTREELRRKAANFLRGHQSPHGSFNYWIRGSIGEKELPCPDDLDDTACALAALTIADPSRMDGPAMSNIVKILTHVESKPGGPYRTWITGSDVADIWKDVDPVVNANIG